MSNYLFIDYDYIPTKIKVYQNGLLVQKWSEKKPVSIIHSVIDDLDDTGFTKIRMKKSVDILLNVFEPKSIKIISKG